jgi:hypothetical protein
MLIMELEDEFKEAKNFVANLNFDKVYFFKLITVSIYFKRLFWEWSWCLLFLWKDYGASTFETTIRHLGGLIAAYEQSGEEILLTK